ncbi:NifB/NifX family molybdenum-iron cluster-binding protein [Gemmatimonadota bacterium]
MRICIPTLDDSGMQAIPSDHFGSAPFFTLVDTGTEEVEIIKNGDEHHVHGRCRPILSLPVESVDAIVCRGLGKRALLRLNDAGIPVLITGAPNVSEILAAYRKSELVTLTAEQACGGGHGHGHGHTHGP